MEEKNGAALKKRTRLEISLAAKRNESGKLDKYLNFLYQIRFKLTYFGSIKAADLTLLSFD